MSPKQCNGDKENVNLLVEKKDLNPKPQMIGVPQNDPKYYFSTHTSWFNLDLYNIVYNKTKDLLLSSLHP